MNADEKKLAEYTNKFRGKFAMDVTLRMVVDTKEPGIKGFSQAMERLADHLRVEDVKFRGTWGAGHLDSMSVIKVVHQELGVDPMVEIPEEATEE